METIQAFNNKSKIVGNSKVPWVGVAAILVKDNTVLIGKRLNAHGENTWAFPGGHLEFFEDVASCARREVLEETGLEVGNVSFATLTNDFFETEQKHYITIFMHCEYIAGEPQLLEPHKCKQWIWADWRDLPKPLFVSVENLLKQGYSPF